MLKQNETGAVNGLAVSLIFAILLLVGALAFGGWAFASRQDYKNNVDPKILAAVKIAKQQESTAKDAAFAEAEKNPLKTYSGPEAYGSVVLQYPKTWSGYVVDSSTGGDSSDTLLDGYFYPGVVPSTAGQGSVFALRLQVLGKSYTETVKDLSQPSSDEPRTVEPYVLPKVPKAVGVKVNGSLPISGDSGDKKGTMVILPLRSQTLALWTEGDQFAGDFNNIILPNFSFSP
jgi:hypothetical protein